MITAWRLHEKKHADHALDGEGAKRRGGRWNNAGVPIVYAAESLELAQQEVLEPRDEPPAPGSLLVIELSFPEDFVASLDPAQLPPDWRSDRAPAALRDIGDAWARDARSAVLRVPSAMVEEMVNYLINPRHPDFARIVAEPARAARAHVGGPRTRQNPGSRAG